jgi:hypothetical protein
MPQGKRGVAAAPLGDGRVLLCGGVTDSSRTNRCDIYNPNTNTFSRVANLPQSKYAFAAAPLANGRVLLCGGLASGGDPTNRCDIYNPSTNSFIQAADLPESKYNLGAESLNDGRVLICGGTTAGYISKRCDIYDVNTNSFAQVASLPVDALINAATLSDGQVFMCGTNECHIYKPELNNFTQTANPPYAVSSWWPHLATMLDNGQIHVCYGNWFEMPCYTYDSGGPPASCAP